VDVMIGFRRQARRAATVSAICLFAAACAGPAATTTPTAAPTTPTAAPTTAPTEVATAAGASSADVTLQEWAVVPSTSSFSAGNVTFNVKNAGTEVHEMVVLKTDLGLLELPTGSDGKVDEEAANLEAMGEVSELDAGKSGSVTLDLAAGRYLLICNVVDADGTAHYGKGMVTEITVK